MSLSLGLGFFGVLNGRGIVKIAECSDAFLVERVLDHLRTFVSQSVDIPKDKFVAVHAFTLGDQVPSLDLVNKVVMTIRNEECCVMHVDNKFECCLQHDKIIALSMEETLMYRSHFSSSTKQGLRGEWRMER